MAASTALAAGGGRGKVAVLSVSETPGATPTSETARLAGLLSEQLRAGGHQVVVSGQQSFVPAEEVSAAADSAGVDLAVVLRAGVGACPATALPAEAAAPTQPDGAVGIQELQQIAVELAAVQRYRESRDLAAAISSDGSWCAANPTDMERYLLEATAAPTVLVVLPAGDSGVAAIGRVRDAIEATLRGVP